MKRSLIAAATAALCATGAFAAQVGQTPSTGAPPRPSPTPQGTVADRPGGVVTMVGCLKHERDVPGRSPNLAEQAGVLEDYILTDAAPAAQPMAGGATTPGAVGTTGSAGAAAGTAGRSMFKIEGIDDERLQDLVNKKVEVSGRVDEDDQRETAGAPSGTRSADDDMPEFEATSIRELPGACDAGQ